MTAIGYVAKGWYLYSEDKKPIEVFDTREAACARLIKDQILTPKETREIAHYLKLEYINYTIKLVVVGRTGEPDRSVQRINGPSSWEEEQADMRVAREEARESD